MHRLLWLAAIFLANQVVAGEERTTIRVDQNWELSAAKIEATERNGKKVSLMVANGRPVLTKRAVAGNPAMSAKAEVIECDLVEKKFVLRGFPEVAEVQPSGKSIRGLSPETVIEVDFRGGIIRAEGPNRVKLAAPVAKARP